MRDDAAGATQSTTAADFEDEGLNLLDLSVQLAEHLKLLAIGPIPAGAVSGIKRAAALRFAPEHRRFRHQPKDFSVTDHHRTRIMSLPMFAKIAVAQMSAAAGADHSSSGWIE